MRDKTRNFFTYIRSNPDLTLLQVMVLSLPFERIPSFDIAFLTIRPSLLIGGVLILRALWLLVRARKLAKFPLEILLIGLFVLWIVLLVPVSINLSRAVQVVIYTAFTISVALSIFYIWQKINSVSRRKVVLALYVAAIATSIFGLYQYFGDFFGLGSAFTGLAERYSWKVFGFARVQSTGLEPLYFGSYLLMPTLILMNEILYRKDTIPYSMAVLALFVTTLGLTLSRGAIYGLIGATLVTFFLSTIFRKKLKQSRLKKVVLAIIMGFLLSLACVQLFNRTPPTEGPTEGKKAAGAYVQQLTNSGVEGAGDDRSRFRNKAINMVTSDINVLMFGIGPGQFGPYIQGVNAEGGWVIVNNLPLEILLETGVIGFLIMLTVIILVVRQTLVLLPKTDGHESYLLFGLLAYLFSQFVQAQTFSTLYILHIWSAIGILLAVNYSTKKSTQNSNTKRAQGRKHAATTKP